MKHSETENLSYSQDVKKSTMIWGRGTKWGTPVPFPLVWAVLLTWVYSWSRKRLWQCKLPLGWLEEIHILWLLCQLWPINSKLVYRFQKKKWCHPQYLLGSEISLELNAIFSVALSLPWGHYSHCIWRGLIWFSQINSVLPLSGGFWIIIPQETWSLEMIVLNIQKFLIIVWICRIYV